MVTPKITRPIQQLYVTNFWASFTRPSKSYWTRVKDVILNFLPLAFIKTTILKITNQDAFIAEDSIRHENNWEMLLLHSLLQHFGTRFRNQIAAASVCITFFPIARFLFQSYTFFSYMGSKRDLRPTFQMNKIMYALAWQSPSIP